MLKLSLQHMFVALLVLPQMVMAQPERKYLQHALDEQSKTINESKGALMNYRQIQKVTRGRGQHWVGDGFPVNNMFSYGQDDNISPFLLLDYAKPTNFEPSDTPRGVGQHPHRGFETVTIVYDGELQHRDTANNHGIIGPGDVQWMTAAHGILHEEMHSEEFTRKGGRLEMVQLWVNLPAKDKMSPPHYQEILSSKITTMPLPNDRGLVRVIAGNFGEIKSMVKTFTPVHIYDIRIKDGASLDIPVTNGFNAMLLVLDGKVRIDNKSINSGELVKFANAGWSCPSKPNHALLNSLNEYTA